MENKEIYMMAELNGGVVGGLRFALTITISTKCDLLIKPRTQQLMMQTTDTAVHTHLSPIEGKTHCWIDR